MHRSLLFAWRERKLKSLLVARALLAAGCSMTPPMLLMTIHIITADVEEEEGSKASTVRPRLLAAFDSARESKQGCRSITPRWRSDRRRQCDLANGPAARLRHRDCG